MPRRPILAVFLVVIVVAIRCVPGQPGIINVGAVIPPMPLKNTPETYQSESPIHTMTPTPTRTPTPTPISTRSPGEPEPLPTPGAEIVDN